MNWERATISTSELTLLEACGVAAGEGGKDKALSLLKAVVEQEGLSVLRVKALAYPLALSFVLEHSLEARDALHLGAAVIARVSRVSTGDKNFADQIERLSSKAQSFVIRIFRIVEEMYDMTHQETRLLERTAHSFQFER